MFLTFARIALQSFGGAMFWLRRALVHQKGWIDDREFVELLGMSQVLPGPVAFNLTLMLGHRLGGYRGAAAAAAGLICPPLVITCALGVAYGYVGTMPAMQAMLRGMSYVAAGLVLANALGLAGALPRRPVPWLFVAAVFVAVALLHFPLVAVMATLGPCAVAITWAGRRQK
ncbi:MAG TPA: chromate transporter [Burkholderiales bacterium]